MQTVPRAEALAILVILDFCSPEVQVHYYGDNKPVVDSIKKGETRAAMSINYKIYLAIFELIREKNITLVCHWMPSHLDKLDNKKERPGWLEDWHIMCNNEADRLADEAASLHQAIS